MFLLLTWLITFWKLKFFCPGFSDDMFQWMRKEADSNHLDADDRRGGLILDEMSIQVNTDTCSITWRIMGTSFHYEMSYLSKNGENIEVSNRCSSFWLRIEMHAIVLLRKSFCNTTYEMRKNPKYTWVQMEYVLLFSFFILPSCLHINFYFYQDDLRVVHQGFDTHYTGMVDMTEDANMLFRLRTG